MSSGVGRGPAAPASGLRRAGRLAATYSAPAALAIWSAFQILLWAVHQWRTIGYLGEAGPPDSYFVYSLQRYFRTGLIYHDLSLPPNLPAIYSPMLFHMLALPGRFFEWANPFFGPRLIVLASFVACIAAVVSLTRALIPHRHAGWLAGLLAMSMGSMRPWVLQLRADFAGIFFGLMAVRLLIARGTWAVAAAGLSAGFATQFKITFAAAAAACGLWLLSRRRLRDTGVFAIGFLASSICLYAALLRGEPHGLDQILTLSRPLRDLEGLFKMIAVALAEPPAILALAAAPLVAMRRWPRWNLLLMYLVFSAGIAAATGIQVGANVNYFYEPLFIAVTPAVLAALHVFRAARRFPVAAAVPAVGLLAGGLFPQLREARFEMLKVLRDPARFRENAEFVKLENGVKGLRILSLSPRVAIMNPDPPVTEPYLLSYLHRLGRYDAAPLAARIRRGEFDLVVTRPVAADRYRTIPIHAPPLQREIVNAYDPFCIAVGDLFHVRAGLDRSSDLARRLTSAGCAPVRCASRDCALWEDAAWGGSGTN